MDIQKIIKRFYQIIKNLKKYGGGKMKNITIIIILLIIFTLIMSHNAYSLTACKEVIAAHRKSLVRQAVVDLYCGDNKDPDHVFNLCVDTNNLFFVLNCNKLWKKVLMAIITRKEYEFICKGDKKNESIIPKIIRKCFDKHYNGQTITNRKWSYLYDRQLVRLGKMTEEEFQSKHSVQLIMIRSKKKISKCSKAKKRYHKETNEYVKAKRELNTQYQYILDKEARFIFKKEMDMGLDEKVKKVEELKKRYRKTCGIAQEEKLEPSALEFPPKPQLKVISAIKLGSNNSTVSFKIEEQEGGRGVLTNCTIFFSTVSDFLQGISVEKGKFNWKTNYATLPGTYRFPNKVKKTILPNSTIKIILPLHNDIINSLKKIKLSDMPSKRFYVECEGKDMEGDPMSVDTNE